MSIKVYMVSREKASTNPLSPWLFSFAQRIVESLNKIHDASKLRAHIITTGSNFIARHLGILFVLLHQRAYQHHIIAPESLLSSRLISWFCKLSGGKHIIIVHDLALGEKTKFLTGHDSIKWLAWLKQKIVVYNSKYAHAIWCVSDNTRDDVIAQGIDPSKIFKLYAPISLPLDFSDEQKIKQAYQADDTDLTDCLKSMDEALDKPVILDVNAFLPHKNPEIVIQALQEVKIPCIGIFVGPAKNKKIVQQMQDARDRIHSAGIHRIFILSDLPTVSLEYLRYRSTLGIQPSMNEGFGMAPVEMANHGKPCIVFDIPTSKEIMQDACFYINPETASPASLAQQIQDLLASPKQLDTMGKKAQKHCKQYFADNVLKNASEAFKWNQSG